MHAITLFFQIIIMDKRNRKRFKIVTSLFDNQRSSSLNNNNGSEDEAGSNKKSKKNDNNNEKRDLIFNCDICHTSNPELPKLDKGRVGEWIFENGRCEQKRMFIS